MITRVLDSKADVLPAEMPEYIAPWVDTIAATSTEAKAARDDARAAERASAQSANDAILAKRAAEGALKELKDGIASGDFKGDPGRDGKDGKDGTSIKWKGNFDSPDKLTNPEYLWAYYNTTDGCSYIYDGENWTLLSAKGESGTGGIAYINYILNFH